MREVIRCRHCRLNQFLTRNGNCRRCKKELHEPTPVAVQEIISTSVTLAAKPRVFPEDLEYGIASTLRILRQAQGMSQKDLADRMGCIRTYVSKVERRAAMPTISNMLNLAKALRVAPYIFMFLATAK